MATVIWKNYQSNFDTYDDKNVGALPTPLPTTVALTAVWK